MTDGDGRADLIVRNARVIDGSGGPSWQADVAVADDRIAAVGDLRRWTAGREVDAAGLALAPGFIDVHTHDDRALIDKPDHPCKTSQGVTTVVAGNCGISLAPLAFDGRPPPPLDLIATDGRQFFDRFGAYLDRLDSDPPAVNSVAQVGHSSLRVGAMDRTDRPATAAEIATMQRRLEAALEAGAAGMSTGLFYRPAEAAPTAEVTALAAVVGAAGGIHTTHMRDEGDRILESIAETGEIGRAARVPVVISHFKCTGAPNHGRSAETLAAVERLRREQPIAVDAYPYIAGSTVLDSARLDRAEKVLVSWSEAMPDAAGRDLDDLASELGMTRREAAAALAPAGGIFFQMSEADVRRILAHPMTMIGSDGLPNDARPHPRLWGTFPRVLGHYARDERLFSVEEAVRKMTALPAARFGLRDRGAIRQGAFADLVLFDPETVIDLATWEDPIRPAAGIRAVFVNGREVWRDGASTGARPGRALRLAELSPARGEEAA